MLQPDFSDISKYKMSKPISYAETLKNKSLEDFCDKDSSGSNTPKEKEV
ncbi:MAG: hypothetical protein R6U52_01375 [Kosmotogaceae bacterium]